jgi:tyrosine-protein kinase Etk/Wzc
MIKKEISFVDYLTLLIKWKKSVIINCFTVCFLVAAISLIIPKSYSSRTTILPPTDESGGFGLSSLLGNLPVGGIGLGLSGLSDGTYTFIAILNSRTVMETVAKKFELKYRYKAKNMEETIKILQERVLIEIDDEGTITLHVRAKTKFFSFGEKDNEAKELAMNMANSFIEQLDKVNRRLKIEKARNTRVFIEKRYNQNLEDIGKAEEEFKNFQEKFGAIALPEQTAAAITAAAELKAQTILKEVEVGVLQKFVSRTHPNLIKSQTELNELNKKLKEFKNNKTEIDNESVKLFLPFDDVPKIGLQYLRLFREVKLQETLLEFLLPQYEQAKIQELRDTPTVQVLDPAVKPEKKSKPKRMLLVLAAGFISIIFVFIAVYITVNLEYIKSVNPERHKRINNLLSELKPLNWFKKSGL